jgi:hypothetical protein
MAKCKAMFTVVDDTEYEKSTFVIEYGPFAIDDNTHPVRGLIKYMDANEKEKEEWQKKNTTSKKIVTS